MIRIILATVVTLIISVIMAMTGRGGGNFYVPVLVATGFTMHQAAATGQLILVVTAAMALLIFQKHKLVDWKLALIIDPPTDIMAFIGGYYAYLFSGITLKIIFSCLLALAGLFMLCPVKERTFQNTRRFGFWRRQYGNYRYSINLWLSIPITAGTGFVAGMVGISGGSFKVPLMVLACGVPMKIAVGTSSAMVATTALMGFLGHTISGNFNYMWAIPLVVVALMGGLLGGKLSIKTKPEKLKKIFAYTTLAAALFMICNVLFEIF